MGLRDAIKNRKKRRGTVRIQMHARFPVPPGYTLDPNLVSDMVDNWIGGDSLLPPQAELNVVDWAFKEAKGDRVGKIVRPEGASEIDPTYHLRQGMIQRFRAVGDYASAKDSRAHTPKSEGGSELSGFEDSED